MDLVNDTDMDGFQLFLFFLWEWGWFRNERITSRKRYKRKPVDPLMSSGEPCGGGGPSCICLLIISFMSSILT